jgi:hypothetical protein
MRISKQTRAAGIAAALAALTTALVTGAIGALGSEQGPKQSPQPVKESVAPSVPTDPPFHGVAPGNAPWILRQGKVRLSSDGQLRLRVRGLVIPVAPGNGTPGPVNTISASLYCGADSNTAAADTTEQVPISREGDASITDDSFAVPATCLSPVFLVHPNGNTAAYIALDGWRM